MKPGPKKQIITKRCLECGCLVKERRHDFCSLSCSTMYRYRNPSNHPNWKGDSVGLDGVHRWVDKHFKKPHICDQCGKDPGFDTMGRHLVQWANVSGKYLRDRSDYMALCVTCHKRYDKQWIGRKRDSKGRFAQQSVLLPDSERLSFIVEHLRKD